jgi:predicted kinase
MRKLVILRGAQGAGKSTFIRNQGLEGFYPIA